MDLYTDVSQDINRMITRRYSSSFGLSSTLFPTKMRRHIYAIYGLVRIADEVVDTYRGPQAAQILDELEHDTYRALRLGYSANPVVHAFCVTARQFGIQRSIIAAFFASMRMDLKPFTNSRGNYTTYIYGSAEAVGLMCLAVFVNGDKTAYAQLRDGACALGAAYQKINFLRDLAADSNELRRWYFPDSSYETFDNNDKQVITDEIDRDITNARTALAQLPTSSRRAVQLSLDYYDGLLAALKRADANDLKQRRLRLPTARKLFMYARARVSAL